jgi:hypothetical protein
MSCNNDQHTNWKCDMTTNEPKDPPDYDASFGENHPGRSQAAWNGYEAQHTQFVMTKQQPENPLQFNIAADNGGFQCPCCGWEGSFSAAPYGPHGGIIGRGICSCCFWEPGFDDNPGASATAKPTIRESLLYYRGAWVASGSVWKGEETIDPPQNWNASEQLAKLIKRAPHLGSHS